jgi:hypothetical protein
MAPIASFPGSSAAVDGCQHATCGCNILYFNFAVQRSLLRELCAMCAQLQGRLQLADRAGREPSRDGWKPLAKILPHHRTPHRFARAWHSRARARSAQPAAAAPHSCARARRQSVLPPTSHALLCIALRALPHVRWHRRRFRCRRGRRRLQPLCDEGVHLRMAATMYHYCLVVTTYH